MHVPGLPSLTAIAVALARKAGELPPDTLAGRSVRAGSIGFVDHIALRSRAIDDALRKRLAQSDLDQVVVLGAGLDPRAVEMSELADVTVFEVDHPATQKFKRRMATRFGKSRGPSGERVHPAHFVEVDFEVDDLATCLERAGHDVSRPTFWLWEGVTMYLTERAIHGTLEIVSSRSSSGSTLALTYGTSKLRDRSTLELRVLLPMLQLIGEPFRELFEPRAIAALVETYGFEVEDDSGSRDWATRIGQKPPRSVMDERLLVAHHRA